MPVKVFHYLPELDAFIFEPIFRQISDHLGLTEWHSGVWLGRLFLLDNDYGEHWFDNWDAREALEPRAQALGYSADELMIVDPERFQNSQDGPCHSPELRRRFWTDVLSSLTLSLELLFDEARSANERHREILPSEHIADLEERIREIAAGRFGPFGA